MGQGVTIRRGDWAGPALLALAVLAALPLMLPGLAELGRVWLTPEYSHGPIIPLVAAFLLMRELARGPEIFDPAPRRWPGVLLLALAVAVAVFGTLVTIPDIVAYALILWVGALVLIGFGWRRGRAHWAPVLHLVFMLPLPQVLYWQVSIFLQLVSSQIGVGLIRAAGVPVYLDGNVIDLGIYQLQVAEACSGLRYLFPILSFSYLFAVLYRGPLWHKALLLLLAAPVTVMMNAVRIGIIGILVDRYGIGQAEGFLHVFEGWVIFALSVAILFGVAWLLLRLSGDRRPLALALDLDPVGVSGQLARLARVVPSRALVAAVLLPPLAALSLALVPQAPVTPPERLSFSRFPTEVAGWSARFHALTPEVAEVLDATDYVDADFTHPGEAAPVTLFSAWYADQSAGSGIHSPEVCLPVGGWEVVSIQTVPVTLTPGAVPVQVNRAVIQKGLDRQIVHYWFAQRGTRMTGALAVKWAVIRDGLLTGRKDGALIRLSTPVLTGETDAEAEARLIRLAAALDPVMPDYTER